MRVAPTRRFILSVCRVDIDAGGPAVFVALTRSELAKWSEVIRVLGVKPD